MKIVAITGTPGTGKSSIGNELQKMGFNVLEIADLLDKLSIGREYDPYFRTFDVDTEELKVKIDWHLKKLKKGTVFLTGHLSHFISCDIAVVLRCRPNELAKRLASRKWPSEKILENVRAEILDVILIEAAERIKDVFEVDTTVTKAAGAAEIITDIVSNGNEKYRAGRIDWTDEVESWF